MTESQKAQAIRVMLVDDHRTLLWGLEKLVQGQSPKMAVVGTAENGDDAVEMASRLRPDVVLLDLDLCGRSTVEIIPALMSNGVSRVLVLTACREPAVLDEAVMRGARGVLHKGANADQVLKAIDRVHHGELWLDHERLGRVFVEMINPRPALENKTRLSELAELTARELTIVRTVVDQSGAPNKVIAARLFISEHTLRNHLTSIYQKLGVSNRLELYVHAIRHGLGGAQDESGPQSGNLRMSQRAFGDRPQAR